MAKSPSVAVRPLPWWVPLVGSVLIAFHLFALLMLSLSARSGPWPSPMGPDMAEGPIFASVFNNAIYPIYLKPLGMIHNYHFATDNTALDGVNFEVILKDETGVEIKRLKFPEVDANFYIKHRQQLLARGLAYDTPVPPRGPEKVAPKDTVVPRVEYWLSEKAVRDLVHPATKDGKERPPMTNPAKLEAFPKMYEDKVEHMVRVTLPEDFELPPGAAQVRPSPWSLVLAKSYMRFLCEKYHAYSAELVRFSRPAVLPPYAIESPLFEPPAQAFTVTIVHYGDLKRDFEEVKK